MRFQDAKFKRGRFVDINDPAIMGGTYGGSYLGDVRPSQIGTGADWAGVAGAGMGRDRVGFLGLGKKEKVHAEEKRKFERKEMERAERKAQKEAALEERKAKLEEIRLKIEEAKIAAEARKAGVSLEDEATPSVPASAETAASEAASEGLILLGRIEEDEQDDWDSVRDGLHRIHKRWHKGDRRADRRDRRAGITEEDADASGLVLLGEVGDAGQGAADASGLVLLGEVDDETGQFYGYQGEGQGSWAEEMGKRMQFLEKMRRPGGWKGL